jgi:phosphatidylserine decarboxylase precursor
VKTKRILAWILAVVALCSCLSFSILAQDTLLVQTKHEPVTQQLITMVEYNADLKKMLIESIENAKKINPDKVTNPAQTLDEYYNFVDWAAKAMPWSIIKEGPYSSLYDKIDQSLDYFYFINDQPLPELKDKGLYNNSIQYYEPYRTWLIHFTKQWGLYLSTEESWNIECYKKALDEKDDKFGMRKGWYEDPSNWKTFNEFFARYLKSPDQRPIAAPNDPAVVSSPADSEPQGVWKIDKNSYIIDKDGVTIKSNVFKSVVKLIGEDSAYKDSFAGGTLTHTFLNVQDYHRYHFPVGGIIKEIRIISSDDAAGGITTWNGKKYVLSSKTPDWQNIETRGCVIIDTGKYGLVALLPVGMSQVSSVNFEANVYTKMKVGTEIKKGDMLGYFLFGGSDFIMLFQNNVEFKLTPPESAHILMGTEYGKLAIKK